MDLLLSPKPLPDPPVNTSYANDPLVPIGATWVNQPFASSNNADRSYRARTLTGWVGEQLSKQEICIREKMVLFWHNHFVTSRESVKDARYNYFYLHLLREHATGNFKALTKAVTLDPAMLRYLNGNQNTRNKPNENYARELLELFTVGRGPLAGPGDYTNYTEDDVIAIAKILTGWRDRGYYSTTIAVPNVEFRSAQHDTSNKQLSLRLGNKTINNQGDREYIALIDHLFTQSAVSEFICRKLYRWFVNYDITPEIENTVIQPLAAAFRENNYEILPVMRILLASEHFFSAAVRGAVIRNPIDFVYNMFDQTPVSWPENDNDRINMQVEIAEWTKLMQMQYLWPPDVAGWKPYYQEPSFYQGWINSVTLPQRMKWIDQITVNGLRVRQKILQIDGLMLLKQLSNPYDVYKVINDCIRLLLPKDLSDRQKTFLKEILLPGLPDYEWTVEYEDHIAQPGNTDLAESIQTRMRAFLRAVLSMPEYFVA